MNKISEDISKDLKDQPKFSSEIGSKDQDHHSFELGEQTTLKKIQHFLHGNPTIVPVIILYTISNNLLSHMYKSTHKVFTFYLKLYFLF